MAKYVKQTTGLTGMTVAKYPRESLLTLYDKLQRVLQKMPQESVYRKSTEHIVNERLKIVQDNMDVNLIERQINGGHIEEVILQAQRELNLSRKMMTWEPWGPLLEAPPKDQWKWPL